MSSRRCKSVFIVCAIITILCAGTHNSWAQVISIERPGEREFIRDLVDMITQEDEGKIKSICDKLLTDKATPIIVVTIESMAKYGGTDMRIETFATLLFNQWQIGHEKLSGQYWNTGILLLISQGDRKARIELGAGWRREKDTQCQQIMDDQIIARFKQGKFSEGIVGGVEALEKMARGLQLPAKPGSWKGSLIMYGIIALVVLSLVSMIRSGSSGWGWLLWAIIFGLIGAILFGLLTGARSRGGGFSGGSFGGGFSGGGGATGSW